MDFSFSEEQQMLRETARRFLDDKAPAAVVRRLMETEDGFDPALWSEIAVQGWQAMTIPEEYGGAGFGFLEQAILMEEMGRSLFPGPYMSSIVLGADLVLAAGSPDQRGDVLPAVAAGETRMALAHLEPTGRWGAGGVSMTASPDGDGFVLEGVKSFVIDGHTADVIVVVARIPGSDGAEGVTLLMVPGDAAGLERTRTETLDQTRKQAELRFSGVRVDAAGVLGDPGAGWAPLSEVLDRAKVALAYEQVGGAERCLEMSVQYAKDRVQFGRPIGSFQAVKHMCADMLVAVESAKSAAYYAGWTVSTADADADVAVPLAKAVCSEAFTYCAGESIQIHGGLGFTWEHDAHLYYKRAKSDELLFGSPAEQRARLAGAIGV